MTDTPGAETLLAGVLVVDAAEGVAGPFAARVLSDLGARCIKVESPAGDRSRRSSTTGGNGTSPAFVAFNRGKESVVIDRETTRGRELFDRLLVRADIVVDDGNLDLDHARSLNGRLVTVSVTPFGRGDPFEGRPATEIIAYAFGGAMSSTGMPDRPPHYLGGSLVETQAGNVGACAAMAGLLALEMTGAGQDIDVSWVEVEAAGLDRAAPYLTAYSYQGEDARREWPGDSALPSGVFPCADGHVAISTYGWTIGKMLDTIADAELEAVLRETPGNIYRRHGRELLNRTLRTWLSTRSRSEATREAQQRGWTITPCNALLELADDPHLRAAGALETVELQGFGSLVLPGPVFSCRGGPRGGHPAPELGADTARVTAELMGGDVR